LALLRIFADENISLDLVHALRTAGHDVLWASDVEPRRPDSGWLDLAELDGRLVLTHDKDFGELIFRDHIHSTIGVILLRFGDMDSRTLAVLVEAALREDRKWYGFFTTLNERHTRQAPLPEVQ